MPVAQIIPFDERLAFARPRRAPQGPVAPCQILQLHRPSRRRAETLPAVVAVSDEDRAAGRGRDPG